MFEDFTLAIFRFTLKTQDTVYMLSVNKGNTLRGGFGICFKRLVCISPARCRQYCDHSDICPYGRIFEPSPPPGSERLTANSDIPRPFVIRPPLDRGTKYPPGSQIQFDLVLFGAVVQFFPYFLVTFQALADEGLGSTRGRLRLEQVEKIDPATGQGECIYTKEESIVHVSERFLSEAELLANGSSKVPRQVTLEFVTSTLLKAEGREVEKPEFHHVFNHAFARVGI